MIFLIFQLFDLLTAIVLVSAQFNLVSTPVLFYHATYLITKAVWYWKDPLSWIDGFAGLYIVAMIFGAKGTLAYVLAGYFLYKLSLYFLYS